MRDPEPRARSQEGIDKFLDDAAAMASAQYDEFICKLIRKVGPCTAATLQGSHVWGYSTLTCSLVDGTTQAWRTQQIVNVSKLGKVFNQWPSRQVKR